MEKNVKICDLCKQRLATGVCSVCKKDFCEYCGKVYPLLGDGIDVCKYCFSEMAKHNFWSKDFLDKIRQEIGEYGLKQVMLNEMEEKKEEDIQPLYTINPISVSSPIGITKAIFKPIPRFPQGIPITSKNPIGRWKRVKQK